MAIKRFEPGLSLSGVVLTHADGATSRVPAMLRFDEEQGALLEISAPSSRSQLIQSPDKPAIWFQANDIPKACIFRSIDGDATLSGLTERRRTQNAHVSTVTIAASEVVLDGASSEVTSHLEFDEFSSRITGLSEWWGEQLLRTTTQTNERGLVTGFNVTSRNEVVPLEWRQGEAQMAVEAIWRSSASDSYQTWSIHGVAMLRSRFLTPATADTHLDSHWKFRSLMVLMTGRPATYAEHVITSRRDFSTRLHRDSSLHAPPTPFVTRRTVREFSQTNPVDEQNFPILSLPQIGSAGLDQWHTVYDAWERLLAPTVSVLSRHLPYVEDEVLPAGIFLDSWGKQASKADGEQPTYSTNSKRPSPTFATYVYRALLTSGGDWSASAASLVSLSIALREVYTAVKHAEKEQPEALDMSLAADTMLLLVRLIAAREIDADRGNVDSFVKSFRFRGATAFSINDRWVDENGRFVSRGATS